VQTTDLPLSTLPSTVLDASLGAAIGAGALDPGAGGARDGCWRRRRCGPATGDVVRRLGVPVVDGQQLRQLIRQHPEQAGDWTVVRGGQMQLSVSPKHAGTGCAHWACRRLHRRCAGDGAGAPGAVEGLWAGVTKTWDVSAACA
jgi:hypothetical protein